MNPGQRRQRASWRTSSANNGKHSTARRAQRSNNGGGNAREASMFQAIANDSVLRGGGAGGSGVGKIIDRPALDYWFVADRVFRGARGGVQCPHAGGPSMRKSDACRQLLPLTRSECLPRLSFAWLTMRLLYQLVSS